MHQSAQKLGFGCLFVQRCCHAAAVIAAAGVASCAVGQIVQEPIGAVLRYEVARPGGPWTSQLSQVFYGERIEWRAVLSFTGTQNAVALGRIYYQPVISNVDNVGGELTRDQLGDWRNAGVSGQANTTLAQGLLTPEEGNSSAALASYGRVHYGLTSRTTNVGTSGALTGIRHNSDMGSPLGSFIRVAGSNNSAWYPPNMPNGSVALNNQIVWGVVSDNAAPDSTWYATGTQDIVLFRQSLRLSDNPDWRVITITSEAASQQRAGGSAGSDDTRFMTWAAPGEGGSNASIRVGVQYVPATIITFIPSPGSLGIVVTCCVLTTTRRRRSCTSWRTRK